MRGRSSIRRWARKQFNRRLLKINSPELLYKRSLKRRKRQLRRAVKRTDLRSLKVVKGRKMHPRKY
jgi:hypothetical protein